MWEDDGIIPRVASSWASLSAKRCWPDLLIWNQILHRLALGGLWIEREMFSLCKIVLYLVLQIIALSAVVPITAAELVQVI